MSFERLSLGKAGEKAAAAFLIRKGHTILEKNYRNRYGEIDLITKEKKTLVFIEVKTRTSTNYGSALAAVTKRKQKQISKVALSYLSDHKLFDINARFDVISINYIEKKLTIEHIEDAFDLSFGY